MLRCSAGNRVAQRARALCLPIVAWLPLAVSIPAAGCDSSMQSVQPFNTMHDAGQPLPRDLPPQPDLATAPPDLAETPPQTFAVIGDYGADDPDELHVSQLVKSWTPDFVVTTGDNNYPSGEASTIDRNVGKYYAEFIGDYRGQYGPGSATNRFWPSIGNHEYYNPDGLKPYLDYFKDLPGNKRYYEVQIGRVALFAINSDDHEPDGITATSVQAAWLRDRLAASTACFKIVYFHIPPFSSVGMFTNPNMNWPFRDMGADAVVMGHEHVYERLDVNGIPYLINGLGGANQFGFPGPILPESQVRFTGDFGALRGEAGPHGLELEFFTVGGKKVDDYLIKKECT